MNNELLSNNNYALMRAAWTAMDQTYGKVLVGYGLRSIDNSGQARQQPWVTPSGWHVAAVVKTDFGGKFTIYKNPNENSVMLVPMGTNGNTDVVGWLSNLQDFGKSQWTSSIANIEIEGVTQADIYRDLPNGSTVGSDAVFYALDKITSSMAGCNLIFAGDSKGGALAQFALNDYLIARDNGDFGSAMAVPNSHISLITHSAPGVSDSLGAQFNPAMYSGISVSHTAALLALPDSLGVSALSTLMQGDSGAFVDAITCVGGSYADGGGVNYYAMPLPTDKSASDLIGYAHRLVDSGWAFMTDLNGDFSSIASSTAPKPNANLQSLQILASTFSKLGQGATVSTLEAELRISAGLACSLFAAPTALISDVMQGNIPGLHEIAATLLAFVPGASNLAGIVCATSILGSAGISATNPPSGAIFETGESSRELRLRARAPDSPVFGMTNQFVGHDSTGGILVVDMDPNTGATSLWMNQANSFFSMVSLGGPITYKFNDFSVETTSDNITAVMATGIPPVFVPEGYYFMPNLASGTAEFVKLDANGEKQSAWSLVLSGNSSVKWAISDTAPEDVSVSRDGVDLILSAPDEDTIRVSDWYSGDGSGQVFGKLAVSIPLGHATWDYLKLTELGLTLQGSDESDTLLGLSGFKNILDGGFGSDVYIGGSGNDTYVYRRGDGNDTIATGGGEDTVEFHGLSAIEILLNSKENKVELVVAGDSVISFNESGPSDLLYSFDNGDSLSIVKAEDDFNLLAKTAGGTLLAEQTLSAGLDKGKSYYSDGGTYSWNKDLSSGDWSTVETLASGKKIDNTYYASANFRMLTETDVSGAVHSVWKGDWGRGYSEKSGGNTYMASFMADGGYSYTSIVDGITASEYKGADGSYQASTQYGASSYNLWVDSAGSLQQAATLSDGATFNLFCYSAVDYTYSYINGGTQYFISANESGYYQTINYANSGSWYAELNDGRIFMDHGTSRVIQYADGSKHRTYFDVRGFEDVKYEGSLDWNSLGQLVSYKERRINSDYSAEEWRELEVSTYNYGVPTVAKLNMPSEFTNLMGNFDSYLKAPTVVQQTLTL